MIRTMYTEQGPVNIELHGDKLNRIYKYAASFYSYGETVKKIYLIVVT